MKDALLLPLVALVAVIIIGTTWDDADTGYRKTFSAEAFCGHLVHAYRDPERKNQPVIILTDSSKHEIVNSICLSFKKGDLICKNAGEMAYNWIHGNDTTVFYQQKAGEDVK